MPAPRVVAEARTAAGGAVRSHYIAPRRASLGKGYHSRSIHVSPRVSAAPAGSTSTLELFSPSKVNLFLRVVRRREDGYHDLASLFHVIDLGDDMAFARLPAGATADRLICSDASIPSDDRNLVIKALKLFRAKTGRNDCFEVHLNKRVPHGAGLGGGSGNAATTLFAANSLTGTPATEADLLCWGGDIGSDISVFFSRGAAYCTGRGEVVEDVPPPLPLSTPLLLVKPPVGLSTPEIFRALDLDRRSDTDPLALLSGLAGAGAATPQLVVNDLEQPAFDRVPELAALKEQLVAATVDGGQAGCRPRYDAVFMTGSGSTIVCVGDDTAPEFLGSDALSRLFVAPARLIVRQPGAWYQPSNSGCSDGGVAAAPAAAAAAAAAAAS